MAEGALIFGEQGNHCSTLTYQKYISPVAWDEQCRQFLPKTQVGVYSQKYLLVHLLNFIATPPPPLARPRSPLPLAPHLLLLLFDHGWLVCPSGTRWACSPLCVSL